MVMKRHKRIAASATTYILLIIALVWTIFPVYWMIKSSITVNSEMYVARPSLIAKHYTFENYVDLFTKTEFPRALLNSLMIAFLTTVCCLLISILGSYATSVFSPVSKIPNTFAPPNV